MSLANYNLNFADPNSFSITCGKLTSWWSVKNDSCLLYTSFLRVETDSSVLTCDFRLNQSGNLDMNQDHAYIQYQFNSGAWVTDTCVSGYGLSAVWFRTFPLTLHYGDYVRFRVIFETNDNTEFWGLQNGDVSVTGNFITYPTEPSPMPVEFVSVECSTENSIIHIDWSTASETNNDYFTIERSDNGIDFYPIGLADGAGNSNSLIEYQYDDNSPINGINYYRIRQTDFDGQYDFSETVSTYLIKSNEEMTIHSENGTVKIEITSDVPSNAMITVVDMTGRSIISENYKIKEGRNQFVTSSEYLKTGIYIIQYTKTNGESIEKKCFLN